MRGLVVLPTLSSILLGFSLINLPTFGVSPWLWTPTCSAVGSHGPQGEDFDLDGVRESLNDFLDEASALRIHGGPWGDLLSTDGLCFKVKSECIMVSMDDYGP